MTSVPDPGREFEAAHERRDWEQCVRIIENDWLGLIFHADLSSVARVMHGLPAEVRRTSPAVGHLAELFGVIPLGSVPVAIPTGPAEVTRLAASDELRTFFGRVSLAFIARRALGHIGHSRAIALAASTVVARTALVAADGSRGAVPGKCIGDLKTFFYLQAGLTAQLADDPAMATSMLNQAWRERRLDATGFASRATAVRLAIESAVAGEPTAARRWLDRAATLPCSSILAEDFAARGADLAAFLIALDTADPEEMADSRAAIIETPDREEQWPFVAWGTTRFALMHGQPERALADLDSMAVHHPRTAPSDGIHAALLAMLRAEAELALGRGTRAFAALSGARPTTYFGRVTEARTLLLAGHDDEALAVAAETVARVDVTRRARIEALLIQSVAELRLGLLADATAHARRAAVMMTDDGPPAALLAVPHTALKELSAAIPDALPLAHQREQLSTPDIYPEWIELVRLTDRESAVLHHLVAAPTREAIATALQVSENTVKSQMRTLYTKLGTSSRPVAIRRARELGLLEHS